MHVNYRMPKIKDKKLLDPHVVIIGAGASKAACPIDKYGKEVPLLRNIHKVLNLTEKLESYGFADEELSDFELLYSKIYGKNEYKDLQKELEIEVRNYFENLVIPDSITLYDYLILSLTNKDIIISFNWDSFLLQAYLRNISVGNLPQLVFPHGNVGVGICYDCFQKGYKNFLCPKCGNHFKEMPLLFPVSKKNYYDHSIIENEWNTAKRFLSNAAGITIFGYGAPESDIEALNLLKESYAKSNMTFIAPFTIINLPNVENEQKQKWSEIYSDRMLSYVNDFKDTILWRNPRVSIETLFDAALQQHPRNIINSFKEFESLEELQNFAKQITDFDIYC